MPVLGSFCASLIAGRGRLFQKLYEGDPVAWGILGAVIAVSIGWSVIKSRMRG